MKLAGFFLVGALLLPAADGPHFDITDARGKKASGVTIEAGDADADGWFTLKVKGKGDPVLLWPFDGAAKLPDGPEPIPAIVIQRGDEKALANPRVVAAIATPVEMGLATSGMVAGKAGLDIAALTSAIAALVQSTDPFNRGIGLCQSKQHAEAANELARALKERQRQLTRVPSEIYAVAVLDGQELSRENKFDEAAVAFRIALNERPSDPRARSLRADSLTRAGKPEAVPPN